MKTIPQFQFTRAPRLRGTLLAVVGALAFAPQPARAAVTEAWVQRYNKVVSNSTDQAFKIALDTAGDIIVTGFTDDYTTKQDMLTIKYSGADGSVVWKQRYNGPANGDDRVPTSRCLAIGPDGSVAITGSSDGNSSGDITYDIATILYRENLPPAILCPTNLLAGVDLGFCSALIPFSVSATGVPQPVVTCTLGGSIIISLFAFPVGVNAVTCTASNIAGVTNCTFTVTVVDITLPVLVGVPSNQNFQCLGDVPAPGENSSRSRPPRRSTAARAVPQKPRWPSGGCFRAGRVPPRGAGVEERHFRLRP